MRHTTCQIKRIKFEEEFKPIAKEYMEYTKTPSKITGIRINARWPNKGQYIQCTTDDGRTYLMLDRDKVIRWR